jgi:hypothetical protein
VTLILLNRGLPNINDRQTFPMSPEDLVADHVAPGRYETRIRHCSSPP